MGSDRSLLVLTRGAGFWGFDLCPVSETVATIESGTVRGGRECEWCPLVS